MGAQQSQPNNELCNGTTSCLCTACLRHWASTSEFDLLNPELQYEILRASFERIPHHLRRRLLLLQDEEDEEQQQQQQQQPTNSGCQLRRARSLPARHVSAAAATVHEQVSPRRRLSSPHLSQTTPVMEDTSSHILSPHLSESLLTVENTSSRFSSPLYSPDSQLRPRGIVDISVPLSSPPFGFAASLGSARNRNIPFQNNPIPTYSVPAPTQHTDSQPLYAISSQRMSLSSASGTGTGTDTSSSDEYEDDDYDDDLDNEIEDSYDTYDGQSENWRVSDYLPASLVDIPNLLPAIDIVKRRRDVSAENKKGLIDEALDEILAELQHLVETSRGLSKLELESIHCRRFSLVFDGDKGCTICFADLKNGDLVRDLKCTHLYHKGCIDRWLKDNRTCPQCRAEVV